MRIDGVYDDDEATEPEHLRVSGKIREFLRAGLPHPPYDNLEQRPLPGGGYELDTQCHAYDDYPADRQRVREIARKVELEVDDERLIDWMKAGE